MIIAKRAAYALAAIVAGTALLVFTSASGAAGARPAPAPSWHAPAVAGFGPAGPRTAPTNPGPRAGTCHTKGTRVCGPVSACQRRAYSARTQVVCSALWARPARVDQGDGWETYTPAGPALVKECQADNKSDRGARECFLGWLA